MSPPQKPPKKQTPHPHWYPSSLPLACGPDTLLGCTFSEVPLSLGLSFPVDEKFPLYQRKDHVEG